MSENPYAPPHAVLATPQPLAEGTGTVDFGRCTQEAWRDTWANFPLWLVAGIVWVLAMVAMVAPLMAIGVAAVGPWAGAVAAFLGILLLGPPLYWGGYAFFLHMHDGGARIGDLFSGFSQYGRVFFAMAGYFLVITLVGLPGQIATQIGARPPTRLWLVGLGYAISLAIGMFITARLNFAPFLIVDRDLGLGEALSQAWSRTAEIKGRLALLVLLTIVTIGASVLALIVGVIPGTVFGLLLWVSAYRQIFGGARAS